jgi:hypothetical protein
MTLFKGASSVVFALGRVDSRREATDETSRVKDAKMLMLRVLGRMSLMVRLPSSGDVMSEDGLEDEGGWTGPGFIGAWSSSGWESVSEGAGAAGKMSGMTRKARVVEARRDSDVIVDARMVDEQLVVV